MSYLLIGLGNPGDQYKNTRHNAGKEFVRWMNKGQGLRDKGQGEFEVVETECFMNESGSWLKSQLQKMVEMAEMVKMAKNHNHSSHSSPSNHFDHYNHLFICHDDLDIPLGSFKIQFGKGPRLHKGILSVEQALGTKEFWRVRIGVDGRGLRDKGQGLRAEGEDYVLEKFTAAEKKILESVFPEIRGRLLKKVSPFKAKNVVI